MKLTAVAQIVAIVCSSLVTTLVFADAGVDSESEQQQQVRRRRRVNEATSSFPQSQQLPQSALLLPPPRDIRINGTFTAEEAAASADGLHVFGPVRFDYNHHDQNRRRVEKGGYIALFDDSVVDVERHALRLAKKLNKEATEIMTETIKAVYLKDLSDDDVAYVRAYPGVKEVDPNFQVQMFNMGSSGGSGDSGVRRDLASGNAAGDMFASSSSNRQDPIETREQDDGDDDDDDDDDSSGDSEDEKVVKATALLTESQKQRQRNRRRKKKQQMKRAGNPKDLQAVPWNIKRVGGPYMYHGTAKVFIIDTGIDMDNPDLNVNRRLAKNFVNPGKPPQDDHGHGTYCAGIVGALDNNIGVVGVRPGVRVVPLKTLDKEGSGNFAYIIAAVEWVAKHGKAGDVVNMSLGGGAYQPLDDAVLAVADKKIWVVIASGNESKDSKTVSPARISHPYVLTVSAMDNNDDWAFFSNYGSSVDVCAPGQFIQSTKVGGGISGFIEGTSFAAPHIAALKLGQTKKDGKVKNDPDGDADDILVYKA